MTLEIGQKAPDVNFHTNEGSFSLGNFKGKKVILYFYPKDDTPGCTRQACDLEKNNLNFNNENLVIIGVSKDSLESHEKFSKKYNLTYLLASDPKGEIAKIYQVWGEKKFLGISYQGMDRATFLISETGILLKIWPQVKVKNHVKDILEFIQKEI